MSTLLRPLSGRTCLGSGGSLQVHTPITRGAAIVGKCLIRRTTQGVSRGFDSHHPLHSVRTKSSGSIEVDKLVDPMRRDQSATTTFGGLQVPLPGGRIDGGSVFGQ